MDKLRRFLNGDDRDDDSSTGIFPNMDATTLSWDTRIKGFILCFVLGIIISFFGGLALFLGKGFALFAVFYTMGNIISMLSTCFLMGPLNQLKKMFAPTRIIATVIAISMMVITFVVAFHLKNPPLSFLCMILQWLAMTWYSLSYIPYARDAVKKTFESCVA